MLKPNITFKWKHTFVICHSLFPRHWQTISQEWWCVCVGVCLEGSKSISQGILTTKYLLVWCYSVWDYVRVYGWGSIKINHKSQWQKEILQIKQQKNTTTSAPDWGLIQYSNEKITGNGYESECEGELFQGKITNRWKSSAIICRHNAG